MNKYIVYPNDTGGVAILCSSETCGLTLEQIAKKDVPKGSPYIVVNYEDIPNDSTFKAAFEADFSQPNGYGGCN